ncbi:hypothetical protein JTB14_023962 [Gonioctena quinquepunctata]|nr:hypothetical protein JTB14_023962 [Gonioctena quinquepunctata]
MFAVLASGKLLPPYIVYKAKYSYPDWIEGGPEGARYNRTKSGWFDSDVFEGWFFQIALPALGRNDGKKGVIPKQVFPSLLKKTLANCGEKISANILSGFEATGISTYNPEKVLPKIRPRNDETNQNNPAMVESFSNIMTELTRVNERPAITRKKKINVPSGKSIGLADLEEEADVISTSDHSSRSSVVDETEDDIMTPVETASDIHESDFILTSFIYNAGTKKETKKLFVAQIMHMKRSCIEIKCLRTYNGKKCAFVFPDVDR